MKRKTTYSILSGLIGAIIFGLFGFIYFVQYGGTNCDQSNAVCDCFCCHMFNSRGYESCGTFGLGLGIVVGLVSGVVISLLLFNYNRSKN